MDSSSDDQRLSHLTDPPQFVSLTELEKLGVNYWFVDPENYERDESFQKIKHDRGYSYQDLIEVSPKTLENYESKIKSFYDEHIHKDEEIRFVLDGSGYFDVRDFTDRWIRIEVIKGDMIVLPAGIFHRFTLDTKNYIKALRLFVGEPVWTPYSRSNLEKNNPNVQAYRNTFANSSLGNSDERSVGLTA